MVGRAVASALVGRALLARTFAGSISIPGGPYSLSDWGVGEVNQPGGSNRPRQASYANQASQDALRALVQPLPVDAADRNVQQQQNARVVGKAWDMKSLRGKSWDELHALWIALYKERNALHAEKAAWKRVGQRMPQATRLSKTKLSMNRIKQTMSQRVQQDLSYTPEDQAYLRAFIDAM
jgi:hypothetical protein